MLSYAPPPTNYPDRLVDTRERTQSPLSQDVYQSQLEKVIKSTDNSHYLSERRLFDYFSVALAELINTEPNWNSYNSATPTLSAIEDAQSILAVLGIPLMMPDRVLPSADGGVSLIFASETSSRAVIECSNDREQLVVLYDLKGNVETLEWPSDRLTDQVKLIDKLQNHLRSEVLAASSQSS
jgi:hypothetical protein